ncbi:TonB-dependent receptor [Thermococcus sp.]
MGYSIYYHTKVERWDDFRRFIETVCNGIGLDLSFVGDSILISPECRFVESLMIHRSGEGSVKTNRVEPYHSLYLLVLHSISSFGSVEVWED